MMLVEVEVGCTSDQPKSNPIHLPTILESRESNGMVEVVTRLGWIGLDWTEEVKVEVEVEMVVVAVMVERTYFSIIILLTLLLPPRPLLPPSSSSSPLPSFGGRG